MTINPRIGDLPVKRLLAKRILEGRSGIQAHEADLVKERLIKLSYKRCPSGKHMNGRKHKKKPALKCVNVMSWFLSTPAAKVICRLNNI
ncbi:hypothetical protein ACLOJK_040194 [Asimina triloba]